MESIDTQRKVLPITVLTVFLLCMGFYGWQNHVDRVGGGISLAKALWLATALVNLFVIPAWLWRDAKLDLMDRHRYAMFFAGFVLRAIIEMPLLLFTHQWRCWHGIAHNAIMLIFLWGMPRSHRIHQFDRLLTLVLLAETLNAWMFSKAGSPQTGIYFASASPAFARINAITWIELVIFTPMLILWLKRYAKSAKQS